MKILFLDIEATDLDADIGHLLCIGYKWAHESKPHILDIKDTDQRNFGDDKELLKAFEPIQMEADLIIHHFGDYYDLPFLQTRRLINGLKPLPEAATVDTWRIARKKLKFKSNRLERLLSVLGCPFQKTPLDIAVWARARWGEEKALKYISQHCKQDVLVLEWVYNYIKGAWPAHPRLYPYGSCKTCGAKEVESRGKRITRKHVFRRLCCTKCGAWETGEKLQ